MREFGEKLEESQHEEELVCICSTTVHNIHSSDEVSFDIEPRPSLLLLYCRSVLPCAVYSRLRSQHYLVAIPSMIPVLR